ncbi:DUF4097 domain-containing protein [Bacillus songklensis]|uniref:DUF4097 domain-containing protein n=1 Tax=Bacillus songklensis TaxID=1069116 RepID=A0ABV8BBR7_9BACI
MIEKRKQILKMVEEGKLSANEAFMLLEALEKDEKKAAVKTEEIVQELSTVVSGHGKSTSKQQSASHVSFKDKFLTFVDQTLKKVKDLDLDFNFGPSYEVRHIFQHSAGCIQQIDIDITNGGVELLPWTHQDVRVECDALVYKVEHQEAARQSFLQSVTFSIENGLLRFLVQKKHLKVKTKIYIPSTMYERVKVRMFNGAIFAEGVSAGELKMKAANGAIHLKNIRAEEAEIETANGHITIDGSHVKNCEAETINGLIRMEGAYEKVNIQTFNGSIKCHFKDERTEKIFLKTTTGSIDVCVPNTAAVEGDLKSNLGNFTCLLPNLEIVEEKNETVQKVLRFRANMLYGRTCKLFAESKTSSVTIKNNG